jgi:hypothetical protein
LEARRLVEHRNHSGYPGLVQLMSEAFVMS